MSYLFSTTERTHNSYVDIAGLHMELVHVGAKGLECELKFLLEVVVNHSLNGILNSKLSSVLPFERNVDCLGSIISPVFFKHLHHIFFKSSYEFRNVACISL